MTFLDAFVRFLPTLGFGTLAVIILVSGFMVAQARRITHAAFFMALAFTAVAGVFVMLGADFLAAAQVLVYVGAIAVMFLFAIMVSDLKELSDNPDVDKPGTDCATPATADAGKTPASRVRRPWFILAGLVAAGFAGLVLAALGRAGVPAIEIAAASGAPTTAPIGRALFTTFLVPFEVASIVLLAALVGAIVIAARENDVPAGAKALQGTGGAGPGSDGGNDPGSGKGAAA